MIKTGWVLLTVFLLAGCASPAQERAASPADDIELTDAEVEAVVAAMRATDRVGREWRERLEGIDDADEREAQGEAYRQALTSAVESQGLTIDRYRMIAQAAREDPALAARIEAAMESAETN